MSNTGARWSGQPALSLYTVLLKPAPRDREAFIDHAVEMFTKIGGSGYEPDVEDLRDDRDHVATTAGTTRAAPSASSRAIVADRDRAPALRTLKVPTTVIHGAEDKLVRPSGGRATAKAIPGAQLVEIAGMGHGLPRGAWPTILDAIADGRPQATPSGDAQRREQPSDDAPTTSASHDDQQQDDRAGDRAALPLIRPEARVRAGRASGGPRAARRPSRRRRSRHQLVPDQLDHLEVAVVAGAAGRRR